MAVFGNNNTSAGNFGNNNDVITGNRYPLSEDADAVASITVRFQILSGLASSWKVKCAIYDSSFNLIDSTDERTITYTADGGFDVWETFNFSSPPALSAGDYWLVVWADYISGGSPRFRRLDTGGTSLTSGISYGAWPDPLVPT
ncbi:hypothetical protein LCGC14_2178210, partial [marine sediment metagenome]